MAYSIASTIVLYTISIVSGALLIWDWDASIPTLCVLALLIDSAFSDDLREEEATKIFPARIIKDPSEPRKAVSPYMFWLKDNFTRITKASMSFEDVFRQARAEFEAIEDKSKWEKLAAEDKERYEMEMATYNDKIAQEAAKLRARKDHNAPKRAASPYMMWLKENRTRLTKSGMSVIEVSKVAGAEWNAVENKSKWEKLAAEDVKRYESEMATYTATS